MSANEDYSERRRIGIGRFLADHRRTLKAKDFPVVAARPNGRLTQEHVAELIGIAPITYQKIEQGKYLSLTYDLLRKIMTLLRVHAYQQDVVLLHPKALPLEYDQLSSFIEPHAVQMVEGMNEIPMLLLNRAQDVLAWNAKAADLLMDFSAVPKSDRNFVVLSFLNPMVKLLLPEWERDTGTLVTELRHSMNWFPMYANRIQEIVDRLSKESPEFPRLWAGEFGSGMPEFHRTFDHPVHGILRGWASFMELIASNGMVILAITPRDAYSYEKFKELGHGFRSSGLAETFDEFSRNS